MNLNSNQKKAVEHKKGPLLIIAGAGTGKTSVITQRIVHIIKQKLAKPTEILALTFTEKAADEMQERVDIEMPYGYQEPCISTFHSFCDQILRRDGYHIGLDTNYSLMTAAQGYIFLKKHLYDLPLDIFRPKGNPTKFLNDILSHFSRLQDEDVSPEEYIKYAKTLSKKTKEEKEIYEKTLELAKVYEKYTELKVQESKLDFGDLIIFTLKLFRENVDVLEKYRKQYKYILVDEFQDTNYTQNVLVNTLSLGLKGKDVDVNNKNRPNLTVVGDDDQAIYKFRGAAISNILQFKKIYKDAKEIVLTENYRSNQEILDSAYSLITKNNPNRLEETEKIDKRLIARGTFDPVDDDIVQLMVAENEQEEAEKISKKVLELTGYSEDVQTEGVFDDSGQSAFLDSDGVEGKYKFSDIAILVRANKHAEAITQALRVSGIPYKLGGSRGLYSREEIKTAIAFLKVLVDPKDSKAMFKLLCMDQVDISPKELVNLNAQARRNRNSLLEELEEIWGIKLGEEDGDIKEKENRIFSKESVANISNLLVIINEALFKIKEERPITDILYMFIKQTGLLDSLVEDTTGENQFKISNIHKFFELAKEYEVENKDTNIFEYVEYLDYCIEVGESPLVDQTDLSEYNAVNILTVHGAKGLEFPVVFMVNLVRDRFPSRNQSDTIPIPRELIKEDILVEDEKESHVQEERRLFYVGATRAKEKLFLTAAKYYSGGVRRKKPSIFLNEILDRDVENSFEEEKEESNKNGFEEFSEKEEKETFKEDFVYKTNSISYSQVNRYQECPKKYKYSYVYKIPTPQNRALSFGSTIHNTLKSFYDIHKRSIESLAGIQEKPTLKDLLKIYKESWISAGYESKEEEKERKKSGEKALKEFYKNLYKEGDIPVGLEEGFSINIGGVSFVGKIDRIDLVNGGEKKSVEIIDYKTGKVKDKATIKKDLQLPLYAIAAEKVLGVRVVKASYIFIEHGEKVEVDISPAKRTFAEEGLVKAVEKIKENDFKPTPGFLCRYCDYNDICEDAQL
jgi:DNA helicase-2/ATP-dependent DNA helicase PcrA